VIFLEVLSEVWRVSFLKGRSASEPYAISIWTEGKPKPLLEEAVGCPLCASSLPAGKAAAPGEVSPVSPRGGARRGGYTYAW